MRALERSLNELLDELTQEELQQLTASIAEFEINTTPKAKSDKLMVNVVKTFQLYPVSTADSYLKVAGVSRSNNEGFTKDWRKLTGDFLSAIESVDRDHGKESA